MEVETRKGNLSDAIDAVSTIDIIEEFNIPNKTRRGRTYLLCPGHDDRHFGSCYVDKNDNGYYCYVCGEHVNKWNMVLRLLGNKKADACEWFFGMSGITPTEEYREDPYKKALHVIRQLEQYIHNDVIYNDMYACDKADSSYGRNINGEYLYSEVAMTNPLLDIYKNNKQAFKNIVSRMLNSEVQKVTNIMNHYETHSDDCLYVDGVGLVAYAEMALICNTIIEDINALTATVNNL